MLISMLPYTASQQTSCGNTHTCQADVNPEVDTSFGQNIWMSMWIYPDYEAGMLSGFNVDDKWIYALGGTPTNPWCVKIGTTRYTGTQSWNSVSPLPNDHTGAFMFFDQTGCAQIPSGQNLGDNTNYMPMNQWSQLIIHVDSRIGSSPNMEAWIKVNGVLTKVAEHTVIWTTYDFTMGRIAVGTTFPGQGTDYDYKDAWIFMDDVKIATSSNDIDLGTMPDTTPPAAPSGLSVH